MPAPLPRHLKDLPMFKIIDNPTFTHTVRVAVPVNGGHEHQTLKASYRVLKTDEIEKFDLSSTSGSTEFLCAVIEKLDDIADANGEPLVWSDQVRDQLLRIPYVRLALSRGYFEGVTKAPAGN